MSRANIAGTRGRQRYHATAQKAPSKANFAIREPPPAGLGLKASLQQLKGAASSLKAQGRRQQADEDVIVLGNEWEQGSSVLPMASPCPSPLQAVAQTHRPTEGILHFVLFALVLHHPSSSAPYHHTHASARNAEHHFMLKLHAAPLLRQGKKRALPRQPGACRLSGDFWQVS